MIKKKRTPAVQLLMFRRHFRFHGWITDCLVPIIAMAWALSGQVAAGQETADPAPAISEFWPSAGQTMVLMFEDTDQGGAPLRMETSTDPARAGWREITEVEFFELGPGKYGAVVPMPDAVRACFYRLVRQSACRYDGILLLNEVVTDNESGIADEDGDRSDWVEIRNIGQEPVQLRDYCLSDDTGDATKWRFPAYSLPSGGHLLVFASGKDRRDAGAPLHTNFRLKTGLETVVLACPDGSVIDRIAPGPIPPDASVGRGPNDPIRWYLYPADAGSPGEPNPYAVSSGATIFVEAPAFSEPAGFYTQDCVLALINHSGSGTIRYTLDGSEPTTASAVYTEPILLQTTTVVRARKIDERGNRSAVSTRTYFLGASHDLAVLSLATAPQNFEFRDGYLYGIGDQLFDAQGNIKTSFPFYGSNAWEEREIVVNFEFFEPEGQEGFNMLAGLKIFGGWGSRGYPQKSMAVFARREYGFGKISHHVFPGLELDQFENLVLRNSGNDNQSTHQTMPRPPITEFSAPNSYGSYFVNGNYTLMRDALVQNICRELGLDMQGYRPAVLYVNGDYWGIYNIREKADEHLIAAHHGVATDGIDLIEGFGSAMAGSATYYNQMRDYFWSHDLADPQNYERVKEQYLEIDNFIDYHLSVLYCQNFDIGNIKCWRPRAPNGRFRWILFDQDYGFHLWPPEVFLPAMARDYSDYDNMFDFYTNPVGSSIVWPNSGGITLLLRGLLANPDFRSDFINRCADLLNSTFRSERVVDLISSMAAVIRPEIAPHLNRWSWPSLVARGFGTPHKPEDAPFSIDQWEANIQGLIDYAQARPDKMRQDLLEHFDMQNGTAELHVEVSPAGAGQVQVHSLTLGQFPWTGVYFVDLPPLVQARPAPGFRFQGWLINGAESTVGTDLLPEFNEGEILRLEAQFEPSTP